MADHTSTPPKAPIAQELPKQYKPSEHEDRVRERWERSGAFHPDPRTVLEGGARPYSVVIPPPNVTAVLHLGHALNNTLQDVLVRAHRMMGRETLWMPGTDHAGIATQTVVERRVLLEEGKRRSDFERDEFIAKIQAFKDEYEARITDQLKRMGCSCDWERQRFTMDPQCARAVNEAFFRLFKDGLIYRGKRLVNWDPVTQTALADDEVEMEEVDGKFYSLRYPLVHEDGEMRVTWSELAARGYPGAENFPPDAEAYIVVATTRPETYLGDTAVAVNPRDPRAGALRGLLVELPIVGRIIPIIEDEYVVLPKAMAEAMGDHEAAADPKAAFATGFLKVTPAHDPNDYELGLKHDLPMINVMAPDARISDRHGWADVGDAHIFVGKTREEARELVVKEFYARGLVEDIKPYRHSVGHSYRSHAAIEPYLSDQWYCKVTDPRLAGAALQAMAPEQRSRTSSTPPSGTGVPPVSTFPLGLRAEERGAQGATGGTPVPLKEGNTAPIDAGLRFFPDRYAKTYEQWHLNIRDWCISRQLWWGHRIPVWYRRLQVPNQPGYHGTGYWFSELDSVLDSPQTPVAVQIVHVGTGQVVDPWNLKLQTDLDPGSPTHEFDVYVCATDPAAVASLERDEAFVRDPDVLDTWFSSALWPMSTMGWPTDTALLRAFNPTDVLCTAREIITLWVSRMVMFNRYFLPEGWPKGGEPESQSGRGQGPLPFRHVFIHAMIQDGEGRKMSKSLGNGVDPLDIIATHGADAMRFTLCQMTTQTQDVRMPVERDPKTGKNTSPKFDLGRNFCNKLWNSARFALAILAQPLPPEAAGRGGAVGPGNPLVPGEAQFLPLIDRWMLSRLASAAAEINAALADYQFSAYAQALYDLHWRDFCDWYLEGIKPTVASSPEQRAVLARALETIVRLLHPVAPFITETIFEQLREIETAPIDGISLSPPRRDGLLATAGWPEVSPALRDPQAEARFERVRTLIEAIRQVRAQHNVKPRRKITLHADFDDQSLIASAGGLVETLADVGRMEVTADRPANAVGFRFEGRELFLSDLTENIDVDAERARIRKQIADTEKSVKTLEGRLANPGYAEKAPPAMVQQTRDQLAKAKAELGALREALERLG